MEILPDDSLPVSRLRHLDKLCDEFEGVLRAGKQPTIGGYLCRVSECERAYVLSELLAIEHQVLNESTDSDAVVVLEVLSGQRQGWTSALERPGSLVIGRAEDAELSLSDDLLASKYHCRLTVDSTNCRLEDLKSRNRTKVNGLAVTEKSLESCDVIRVGETEIAVFIVAGSTDSRSEQATQAQSPLKHLTRFVLRVLSRRRGRGDKRHKS